MLHRRLLLMAVAATLVVPSVPIATAAVVDGQRGACMPQQMPGGEWSTYGADLPGTQDQRDEHVIGPGNVASLQRQWITGNTGYQSPPPIVADACVFINTNGHIEALNLATGKLVWTSRGADTTGTFAVTVVDGRVLVGLNNNGKPAAAAFDERDGRLLWVSKPIYFGYQATQQSSAIVFRGLLALFTTGPEADPKSRDGYGLIDVTTGDVVYKSTVMPAKLQKQGFAGGGVWGTPTVDPATGYLYVGTANPGSKTKESVYDNAILKLDVDRQRRTFGQIVATFKGSSDSATGYDNPVCQSTGDTVWAQAKIYAGAPTCGQTDVDFGVGPTLWRNSSGRLMGAALQKSGWLRAFYADTMKLAWAKQVFVSLGPLGGEMCRIATDGKTLFAAANPGVLYALRASDGSVLWKATLTGVPMKGGNVALANGVVYYVDEDALKAFDAKTGSLLWMSAPTPAASIGSGVAVAGHYVVANHYGEVAAYKLG